MKTARSIALATILALGLGAFAFGAFGSTTQLADTSGQPNEWDVGNAPTNTNTTIQLADTSGQPNEWDVGSTYTDTTIQLADTSGQPNEWDVG